MMAKGNDNGKGKKGNSYKPYDASNSFVKRVTNKVSELLPQPSSWISKWLSTTPQSHTEQEDEDDEQETLPPSKKVCLSQSINDYTHQNNIRLLEDADDGELSPILSGQDTRAGPSGVLPMQQDEFISSTPAMTNISSQHSLALNKVNGDDGSDSSDSTSGCSSLVPQADKSSVFSAKRSRLSSTPAILPTSSSSNKNPRSLFSKPKYPKVDISSDTPRGTPNFDPSIVHSSYSRIGQSRVFKDETTTISSPFYRGRTMYGGASSCRELLDTTVETVQDSVKVISVRPTASPASRDTMGTTARKILDALEKFSTPVLDAKRIPIRPNVKSTKRKLPQPYQELSIPQLPDLLRIKRRETQQRLSTSSSRTSSITPTIPETPTPTKKRTEEFSFREESGKEKEKSKSLKCVGKEIEDTPTPQVNLPSIALPVTTLPVFNISLPKPPAQKPKTLVSANPVPPLKPSSQMNFKFSNPISVMSQSVSVDSVPPTISFSNPLEPNKTQAKPPPKKEIPSFKFETPVSNNKIQFSASSSSTKLKLKRKPEKEEKTELSGQFKPAAELKTGSVMDFFSGKKGKDVVDTSKSEGWECKKCKRSNNKDTKCGGCGLTQSSQNIPQDAGFGNQFKLTSDKWECGECLVRNSNSDIKCVACGTSKPGLKSETKPAPKQNSLPTVTSSFGESFKPPPDTWECKECLVRNKSGDSNCVACSSPKPGGGAAKASVGLSSLLKKAEGGWECDTCLVQNKSGADSCVACSTPRAGAAPPTSTVSTPLFSFGIPPSQQPTNSKPGGFTFNLSNNADTKTESKVPTTGFTFGIDNANTKSDSIPATTFKFGSVSTVPETPKATFSFGVPAAASKEVEKEKSSVEEKPIAVSSTQSSHTQAPSTTRSLVFGVQSNNEIFKEIMNATSDDKEDVDRPSKKRVSFGEPLVEEKKISPETSNESATTSSGFTFGNPVSSSISEGQKFLFTPKNSLFGGSNSNSVTSTTSTPVSAPSIFKFGVSTASSASTFTTATATTTEETKPPAPVLSFTNTNTLTNSFTSQEKKDNPFGILGGKPKLFASPAPSPFNSTPSSTSETKPVAFEAAPVSEIKPLITNTNSKNEMNSNVFGVNNEKKPMFTVSMTDKKPNFFGPSSNAENKPSFFTSNVPNDNKSVFGSNQSDTWGSKPVFNSGTEAPSAFGGAPTTTAQGFSGFGMPAAPTFTNSNESAAPQAAPFTFNALPSQPQTNNSMFSFKAEPENKFQLSAPTTTQSITPFGFSVPQPAPSANAVQPSFQQPSFGTPSGPPGQSVFGDTAPIFGAPNPSPAPFTFGASQPEQPATLPPMFGFSAQQSSTTVASNQPSFAFGSQNATPAAPAPPPSFDPNIKPSFNFTGGATPSFSATPTLDMPPPGKIAERKIRRAVRRTPHK